MGNPLVPQGLVNKLFSSLSWATESSFNVTPPYLGPDMIRLSEGGPAANRLPTATGQVPSLEPYIPMTVRIHLLKTQAFADLYKRRRESYAIMGDCTVRADVVNGISPYQILNCSLDAVEPLDFNGSSAGWVIEIGGYYLVNNDAWG